MIERLLRMFLRFSTAGPALNRYYLVPHVKLHRIHSSDDDFHTHPWNALSLIFGWYWEERGDKPKRLRLFFNRVFAFTPHKVTISRPVWTLFIHGRRRNDKWQYGKAVKPWQGSDQERQANLTA